jgi:hypothetical protein
MLAVFQPYHGMNQFYIVISWIMCASLEMQKEEKKHLNTENWIEILTITVVLITL